MGIGKPRALAVTTATRANFLNRNNRIGRHDINGPRARCVSRNAASNWYGVGAPKNTPAEIVDAS
jgi:hypothetical protein